MGCENVPSGLIPSDAGAPGGKDSGQKMTHYITPGLPSFHIFGQKQTEPAVPFKIALDLTSIV
jgi:hypothetical protein